jgi:TIR domain/Bacterial SH3 domain
MTAGVPANCLVSKAEWRCRDTFEWGGAASGFRGALHLLRSRQRGNRVSDVFISYSRDNQEVVRRLAEAVKALGYDVWWDDQLPPHLAYGDLIQQKIGGAKAAIVVWSTNAAASEWVRAEADMARGQRKLIQTTIDGAEPPMPFNQLHYVSLADWSGEADHPGWTKVKESLAALAGPTAATAGPAAAPPVEAAPPPAGPSLAKEPLPAPAPSLADAVAAAAAVAAAPIAAAAIPPPTAPDPVPLPPPEPATPPAPAAPPPPPPPPSPPAAARPKGGGNKVLIILIVLSVLVIAAVAVLALTKGRSSAPAGNQINATGPADNGSVPAPDSQFTQEATLQGEDEFANVRAGPAADQPIVARINAGETFNTYPQDGIWWRVRITGGLVGYLERARIRTRDPVGVPPLDQPQPDNGTMPVENGTAPVETTPGPTPPQQQQPTPPQQQQQPRPRPRPQDPRPPRRDPRINDRNAGVMYDFCKGAGAGTPQCRQLGLSPQRRPRREYR